MSNHDPVRIRAALSCIAGQEADYELLGYNFDAFNYYGPPSQSELTSHCIEIVMAALMTVPTEEGL